MQPIILKSLLSRKQELEEELEHLDALIAIYQRKLPQAEVITTPLFLQTVRKQARVRGVLAAARKAIDELSGPFDKNQLLVKLIEMDEEFVHKKITGSNIRNTLRLLTQAGVIKIASEATATRCARYVKVA
jgi:hypothetical protein